MLLYFAGSSFSNKENKNIITTHSNVINVSVISHTLLAFISVICILTLIYTHTHMKLMTEIKRLVEMALVYIFLYISFKDMPCS